MAHRKAKDHFRDAVEWMVHNKLNPDFDRNKSIYRIAFKRLENEVKGWADSKFISSAWTPEFNRAIRARPEFCQIPVSKGQKMLHHCDACNRSNHPASFIIGFTGSIYHPESLEPLLSGSEDENDEDDGRTSSKKRAQKKKKKTKISYNVDSQQIPPANHVFYVGSTCKGNAEIAHSLLHWRFHLNEWAIGDLTASGYLTEEQVARRKRWSAAENDHFAQQVVKDKEMSGEIADLYRDFKGNLDRARDVRPDKIKA
jgi:hypothetical protein